MTARWCVEADDRTERGEVAMLVPDVEGMWTQGDRTDDGEGYGCGDGDDDGDGDGYGFGYGEGDGYGCGYGTAWGDGYGDGDGYGHRNSADNEVQIWLDWRGRDNAHEDD